MYNSLSITTLQDRIGWSNPMLPNSEITLDSRNTTSVSERQYNSFHQLVVVENVKSMVLNKSISNSDLNDYLFDLKKTVVLEVLSRVFDTNIYAKVKNNEEFESYGYRDDYSDVIIQNQSLFDQSIGYLMASKCLQLFLTSNRSNSNERSVSMSWELIKTELEGMRDEKGRLIATGSRELADLAIKDVISILFPIKKKSNKRLIGRKIW